MKILHLLFDDYPYIVKWGYQENKFVKYQLENNDVTVVAGRYIPSVLNGYLKINELKQLEVLQFPKHVLKIYRLDCLLGNLFIGKKIKYYINLEKILKLENPDCIFVHDLHSLSLITLDRYLKARPIKCIADVHVNYINSCRNQFSYFLHRYIYRFIIRKYCSCISKIYYLNENSKQFLEKLYGLDIVKNNLEFLPLGGEIVDIKEKGIRKSVFAEDNHLPKDCIIFTHSGKMNFLKKTLEILDAFIEVQEEKFCLLLIGIPAEEIKEKFYEKVNSDKRIKYLGWKTNQELMNYLMVSDVYLQPGTPSVTAHEALCKGCATVLSQDGNFYTQFIDKDSAIYLTEETGLKQVFEKIKQSPEFLGKYQNNGYNLAERLFDYRVQSEMVLK